MTPVDGIDWVAASTPGGDYELTLFVNGASEISARAVANARLLCDRHLKGRHRLSVVDINDDTAAALTSQVLVAPTLVRDLPLPARRLVGDLSDTEKVLRTLGLPVGPAPRSGG